MEKKIESRKFNRFELYIDGFELEIVFMSHYFTNYSLFTINLFFIVSLLWVVNAVILKIIQLTNQKEKQNTISYLFKLKSSKYS